MAISDDLNSIRTHLEDDYTALEQLGVSVEDRNIENIKDMANQIYAKFPKTDYAEGSNITLSNTLKGKLDFEDGIVGIGDTSQKNYSGKNLFPNGSTPLTNGGITFTPQADGGIKVKGTSTYANYYTAGADSQYVEVANLSNIAEAVTLSVSGMQRGIEVYVVGQTLGAQGIGNIDNNINFTTILNDKYRLIVRVLANYEVDTTLYIQLEKGSSATSFEKYVGGTTSPNPSYPQDIEVVRGKNEANPNNLYLGQTLNTNGTLTPLDNRTTLFENPIKPNTQYTLSINNNYQIGNLFYYNKDKTYLSQVGSEWGNNKTATTPANAYYISFATKKTDNTAMTESDIENLQIQIEKGSQATSYLPYNTLEVVERGKNWLPNNSTTQTVNGITYTINEDKSITISGTATARADIYLFGGSTDTGNYLHIPKGTYVLNDRNKLTNGSLFLAFREKTAGTKYETTTSDTAMELLANQDCYFYGVMLAVENGVTLNQMTFYPMVSNETTTYEPYQTPQTYQLSLGEYEFAKIGNYVDTIEYDVENDKWYKKEQIGKARLTGTAQTWASGVTSINEKKRYYTDGFMNAIVKPSSVSVIGNVLCNYYKPQVASSQGSYGGKQGISVDAGGRIYINDDNYQDNLDGWKTWLNGVTCELYYALQTANDIEITGTLKDQIKALYNSQSYTGTTIIEIDGQLPLIIKVRALKGE